ncbi:MAG: ATP synthase F1 subunit delta [Acidobacteriota bacterium]
MSIETIARRYSVALADVVAGSGQVDIVKAELGEWQRLISGNSDLQSVFSNPAIPHANKEKLLEGLLEKTRPAKQTANFLRILLKNGRLTELGEINTRFESELESRGGIVSAEVSSARELPEGDRNELRINLEKLTGKKIKIDFATDPNLIGGVVTRIGSTVYDGSVKTQLENLKEQLVNG